MSVIDVTTRCFSLTILTIIMDHFALMLLLALLLFLLLILILLLFLHFVSSLQVTIFLLIIYCGFVLLPLYYIILYYIILYYIVLYYIILYYIIYTFTNIYLVQL